MDWEANCGYKLCGQYVSDGEEQVLFFDLSDPQITLFEQIPLSSDEDNVDEDIPEEPQYREERKILIPKVWGKGTHWNCIALKEMDYCGDWKIMQPTSVFRLSGNVSQKTMDQVRIEAENLLESFQALQAE